MGEVDKRLARLIKQVRRARISHLEECIGHGISKTQFWRLENGYSTLSWKKMQLILARLGLYPEEIPQNTTQTPRALLEHIKALIVSADLGGLADFLSTSRDDTKMSCLLRLMAKAGMSYHGDQISLNAKEQDLLEDYLDQLVRLTRFDYQFFKYTAVFLQADSLLKLIDKLFRDDKVANQIDKLESLVSTQAYLLKSKHQLPWDAIDQVQHYLDQHLAEDHGLIYLEGQFYKRLATCLRFGRLASQDEQLLGYVQGLRDLGLTGLADRLTSSLVNQL